MRVLGTRVVTRSIGGGQLSCQQCGVLRTYCTMRVRRYFTLFEVPVVPLGIIAEYVECDVCRSTWRDDVVPDDGRAGPVFVTAAEAEFRRVIKRVMVMMTMADGEATESEVALVRELYQKIDASGISAESVAAETSAARRDPMSIEDYLSSVAAYLNRPGKELVVKAALLIAGADSRLEDSEAALLDRIARGLDLRHADIRAVIAEARREAGGQVPPPALSA